MNGTILVSDSRAVLEVLMKPRLAQSLKQFIPAAFTFAGIFTLFRVYEFILLRGTIGTEMNLFSLEFGSVGYDLVFSFSLIFAVLIIHLFISIFTLKMAKLVSGMLFSSLLILNFVAIQYFSTTQSPLGVEIFRYTAGDILNNVFTYWGIRWTTITPIIVIMPLVIAAFSALKEWFVLHNLPHGLIIASLFLFLIACFLPKSPSPEKFHRNIDYYTATNKTHFFLSRTVDYALIKMAKQDKMETLKVRKRAASKSWR